MTSQVATVRVKIVGGGYENRDVDYIDEVDGHQGLIHPVLKDGESVTHTMSGEITIIPAS